MNFSFSKKYFSASMAIIIIIFTFLYLKEDKNKSEGKAILTSYNNPAKEIMQQNKNIKITDIKYSVGDSAESKINSEIKIPLEKEYGVWIWNSPITMSELEMDAQVKKVKSLGFNVIYISVDDLFDYKKINYNKALAKFITKANSKGLAVDAVAGDTSWGKPADRNKGFLIIDYIIDYNINNPKFRGFQYDVESYLLPEYEEGKYLVLSQFIEFIDLSAKKLVDTDIKFSIVIPHFYDSAVGWTPKIEFKGSENYTYEHLLSIMDNNKNSSIIVMAYRNFVEGENGIIDISNNEVIQADKTKVIIAQETGNHKPYYITHFGKKFKDLNYTVMQIFYMYSNNNGFGGVAIHDLKSLNKLK